MRLRYTVRFLFAGLVAGSALVAPAPDPRLPTLDPPSAFADGGDWPMFGHDPAHTGYNSQEAQLKPLVHLVG